VSNPSSSNDLPGSAPDTSSEWLPLLLRGGVYASFALLVIALIMNGLGGKPWIESSDLASLFAGETGLSSSPIERIRDARSSGPGLNSLGLVDAGILILILLPGMRVAFLFADFTRKRDWTFSALSFFVLLAMSIGSIKRLIESLS
jgi:uncharacterized membrane protein